MLLFLPRYFKRAEQNAAVGLGAALEFLVDLVSLLQTERRFSKVTARFIGPLGSVSQNQKVVKP